MGLTSWSLGLELTDEDGNWQTLTTTVSLPLPTVDPLLGLLTPAPDTWGTSTSSTCLTRASLPGTGPTDSGPGYMGYFDIKHMLDEGLATRYWDDERKVPYIVTNTNDWIGYDDAESFTYKLDYLKSKGVRGTLVWAIDLDVLGEFPLLNVIRDSLADYNPLGDNPVDLDGSAANDSTEESGANTAIIAVLASGVGLAALAGGLYMFFQGVPSMPSLGGLSKAIPEPSAPK